MLRQGGDKTDPFVAAVRATRMPMVISDPRQHDNPIVFVNDAFCRMTGYSRHEVVGRNCRFLQGPDTDPATRTRLRAAIAAREPIEIDLLNYRKDGQPFWNRLQLEPVRDEVGEVAYFFASQVDVTLQRELVEELRISNLALLAENADRALERARNEARLGLAVEAGRLGVFERDLVTEEMTTSPRMREHHGHPADGAITFAQLRAAVHPDDLSPLLERLEHALVHGGDFDVEYRVLRGDGPPAWLQVRGLILRDPSGHPTRMVGTSADVTEVRLRADASQASEERLRVALEAGELGTWELDLDTDRAVCSGRHNAIFGYAEAPPDWGATIFCRHVVAEDRPIVDAAFERAMNHDVPFQVRVRIHRADDGALCWIEARGRLLPSTDGGGRRMTGVVADVTAAVEATEAQRRLSDLLESRIAERTRERDRLWQTSTDLLIVIDTTGIIIAANPAWTRLLGWTETELVGRNFAEFVVDYDLAASEAALVQASTSRLDAFENRCRHRDGSSRTIEWTATPDEGRIAAIGRDVTAEREADARLRAAEASLRQAQKMEAVGQLTGGIAHDFNNLLTGIMGALELVETRIAQNRFGELSRYVSAARQGGERAAALTQRLLAFSRQQSLDPKPVRVGPLIAGVEDLIRRTLGTGVDLVVTTADDLWDTLCDPNQLENALLNLCINGRDAMPGGGRLTIAAHNAAFAAVAHTEWELPVGDYVSVTVTDIGGGMAPEVVARAFDPFFTTKPIGQGTGLGLSMTYGFARQSGGTAHIESDVGRGTSVSILLPRHDGPGRPVAAPR